MQRLETFVARWRVGSALLVWLALSGVDARASMPRVEMAPHEAAATRAMSQHGPHFGDCLPCAYCYSAPPTSLQGFSGESKDSGPADWWRLAKVPVVTVPGVNSGWRRALPVPLRITYCRWSN